MTHLNIDWEQLVQTLQLWSRLSMTTRQSLLQLRAGDPIPNKLIEHDDYDILAATKLFSSNDSRSSLTVTPEGRPFLKAMRGMNRHHFLTFNTEELENYVSDHLAQDEQLYLMLGMQQSTFYGFGRTNCVPACQLAWLEEFLKFTTAKDARKWEKMHLPHHVVDQSKDGSPYFSDVKLFEATQHLVKTAMTWDSPVMLADLPGLLSDIKPALLWRAVMACVRYLFLIPRLEQEALMPIISINPHISYILHRPAPIHPKPINPQTTYAEPYLIHDMMTILVTASTEPIRQLANGQDIYQKDRQRIAESLTSLPIWMCGLKDLAEEESTGNLQRFLDSRINHALNQATSLKLLKHSQRDKTGWQYAITNAGHDWLSLDMRQRITKLVDPWRQCTLKEQKSKAAHTDQMLAKKNKIPKIRGFYDDSQSYSDEQRRINLWQPTNLYYGSSTRLKEIKWSEAYIDLFAANMDAPEAFYPTSDLLEYHTKVNNPLLGTRLKGTYGPNLQTLNNNAYRQFTQVEIEDAWYEILAQTIEYDLCEIGAVECCTDGTQHGIRLSSIGRYMLGLADDFDYKATPEGSVIIQPNFDVVFMGPSPSAEARFGRLAQRTGQNMGVLFRITRESILAAAAAGIQVEQALSDFQQLTSKPLPDNVRREITGWFASTATIRLRQAWIIDTPDLDTATRAIAVLGKNARQLTPTLLEVTAKRSEHATLKRKLSKAGIFIR